MVFLLFPCPAPHRTAPHPLLSSPLAGPILVVRVVRALVVGVVVVVAGLVERDEGRLDLEAGGAAEREVAAGDAELEIREKGKRVGPEVSI